MIDEKATLSDETAVEQIRRLAALRGCPVDNAVVVKDLVRVLQKWLTGGKRRGKFVAPDEQCRLVVDRAVEEGEGWKGPRQLRDIIDDLFPNYPEIE